MGKSINSGGVMRRKVCIVQPRLAQYREPFYQRLKALLDQEQIDCVLIHGQSSPEEIKRNDEGFLDWAIRIRHHTLRLRGIELLWQPCLRFLRGADLVIVQQENRLLLNYLLMAKRRLDGSGASPRLGFWGHGVNCQSDSPASLKERWKRALIRQPDWWFAYTDFTRDILLREHYPEDRITVVENAIDTAELRAFVREIPESEVQAFRRQLGIQSERVGIFCGALYRRKRIDFLIDAARKIRAAIPDFELVIVGSGPDEPIAREAARQLPWIHAIGHKSGRDKALALRLGRLFLMPRLVGLSILDAFVAGLPLVTTRNGQHGPEISYLRHGENGWLTADSPGDFATEVIAVLSDEERLGRMRENCLHAAARFTVEAMASNFACGVTECLNAIPASADLPKYQPALPRSRRL